MFSTEEVHISKSLSHGKVTVLRSLWQRYANYLIPLLIFGFTFALFWRTFNYGLYLDDYHHARPWTFSEVLGTFAGPFDPLGIEPPYFRPLTVVTFWLDWNIWGYNAWGYHLTNVTLHALASVLLYLFAYRAGFGRLSALVAGLFFACIPLNAATAIYISERSDALVAIFTLTGLLCVEQYRRTGHIRWLVAVNSTLVLALCSKEIGIALPLLVGFYWFAQAWLKTPPPAHTQPESGSFSGLASLVRQWLLELKQAWSHLTGQGAWKTTLVVVGPPVLITFIYLVYRAAVLAEALRTNVQPPAYANPVYGLGSSIFQTFKAVPWEVQSLALPVMVLIVGLTALLYPSSINWRYWIVGFGMLLMACLPLAPMGKAEPRLLYVPAIGLALSMGAFASVLIDFASAAFRKANAPTLRRLFAGGVLLGVLAFLSLNLIATIQSQDEFTPYSKKVLDQDIRVYTTQELHDRFPSHAIQFIEDKLRSIGQLP